MNEGSVPFPTIDALHPALEQMPPLLLSLDLIVKRDQAPSGLVGLLSIGVQSTLPVVGEASDAPAVLVSGEAFCVTRPRPSYEDMLSAERLPDWL